MCDKRFALREDLIDSRLCIVGAVGWALDVFDNVAFCGGKREAKLGAANVDSEDHVAASGWGDGFSMMRRTSKARIPDMAMAMIMGLEEALKK